MNVPGYYGLGTALARALDRGQESSLRELYRSSLFFRTLLDNSMQSLSKTHFSLTSYLSDDPSYGSFWSSIQQEANRTTDGLLKISGMNDLLENEPNTQESIRLREDLILPVAVIQQWALIRLRQIRRIENGQAEDAEIRRLEQVVIKSMAATVNASRNAV